MQRNDSAQISALENTQANAAWWHAPLAGIIGGISGGGLNYPFEAAKKRAQSSQTQPWRMPNINPYTFIREVYRGGSAFTFSLAPVSMMQVTLHNILKNNFLSSDSSNAASNAIAVASGAAGAFFSAPIEHIILTQQKQKTGPIAAMKHLYSKGMTFAWTALPTLMVREAGFGFSMLMGADAAADWVSRFFQKDLRLPATIGVGVIAAAITHPFDTIGTYQQRHEYNNPQQYRISLFNAAKQIYAENGIQGFFKGYAFRSFLFTGCMISIGTVEKFIQAQLTNASSFTLFKKQNHPAQPIVQNEEAAQTSIPRSNR